MYWQALGCTYWVHWHMVEIIGPAEQKELEGQQKVNTLTRKHRLRAGRLPIGLLQACSNFPTALLSRSFLPASYGTVGTSSAQHEFFPWGMRSVQQRLGDLSELTVPCSAPCSSTAIPVQAPGGAVLPALPGPAPARGRRGAEPGRVVGAALLCEEAASTGAARDHLSHPAAPGRAGRGQCRQQGGGREEQREHWGREQRQRRWGV